MSEKPKWTKITYKRNIDSTRGKRPDIQLIEEFGSIPFIFDKEHYSIEEIIDILKNNQLTDYISSQIDSILVKEGYFLMYNKECEEGKEKNPRYISNWRREKIGIILSYDCEKRNITSHVYSRHITEDLKQDSHNPEDVRYTHIVTPTFFKFTKDDKEKEGWIINSKDLLFDKSKN